MPKAKKSKAKPAAASGRTTRAEATRQMSSRIPKLPNEVVDAILEVLKVGEDFKTLNAVARVSHTMYDIAIPKIYETVVFAKKGKGRGKNNHAMVAYGHSSSTSDQHNQGENIPTRKDIATSHTRKLVFEEMPKQEIHRSYRAVNEVEIHAQFLYRRSRLFEYSLDQDAALKSVEWTEIQLQKCLKVIISSSSSAHSLHVTVYDDLSGEIVYEMLGRVLAQIESAIPCTFEFFNILVDYDAEDYLPMAYDLQAVLHLDRDSHCLEDSIADDLAMSINDCFEDEDIESPAGQLYLCGLPRVILSAAERHLAHDVKEAALIKLFKHITVWPNLAGSHYKTKLEFFKSRIKLVEPGFRPSLADLYPRPQPSRGLCHMLVDKETIVPDDEWSLTDEDPIDSESEYYQSDTSCSDAGSGNGEVEDGEE